MENTMIRFVLKATAVMMLLSVLAIAVWAFDIAITAEGTGDSIDSATASEQAYQQARQSLKYNCTGGDVRDVHTDEATCSRSNFGMECHVTLGAICHIPDGGK